MHQLPTACVFVLLEQKTKPIFEKPPTKLLKKEHKYNKEDELNPSSLFTPDWTRTNDAQLRTLSLYPTELPRHQLFIQFSCRCSVG